MDSATFFDRIRQAIDVLLHDNPARSGTAARYGLPGTVSLRSLPYGPPVADYATDLVLRTRHSLAWPGCLSVLGSSLGLFALLTVLTPDAWNILIAGIGGLLLPLSVRRLRARKLPRMDVHHLEEGDLRRDLDGETRRRLLQVRPENLRRLACVVKAVNTFNRFHRQVEVALRTLEMKGEVPATTVDNLRRRLQEKHGELTRMVSIFGSLLDGEMNGVVLDEDGRSALLASSLASDGSAMDIDIYLGRVLDNLEEDIRTIEHASGLDRPPLGPPAK